MRTHRPFLCLCFKTKSAPELASDFNSRASPCVYLRYDTTKKAYALLTIPNLYVTYSIEVRFVAQAFPLRVTNYLSNQLNTFLRPTVEDKLYSSIHGPAGLLRRHPIGGRDDDGALISMTPATVRAPSARVPIPSIAGLESLAYGKPQPPSTLPLVADAATIAAATTTKQLFTSDQLAARTPRNYQHALKGPDRDFWIPGIKKDFAMIRDMQCIVNITEKRPHGPAPPPVEQRFKIKHKSEQHIALEDIPDDSWKVRTVARGDRFRFGVHYDATAAPVVHMAALKMLVAWAVFWGLQVFQWDVTSAFYGNDMDQAGIIVQLPPGYNPYSTELRDLAAPPLYGELAKALPGIPQGSLLHYKAIAPELQQLGFNPLPADNCLFLHNTARMATSLFVDDGLLACPSLQHAEQVLGPKGLGRTRKITWAPLSHTLGIDFKVDYNATRRVIFLSQRTFAYTILERAGMVDCNPAKSPACAGRRYSTKDCPTTSEQKAQLATRGFTKEKYHSIQASINFLVCVTRDNLRFINGKLAKFCTNPGEEHFKAQKHELRFIKGTLDYGIEFVWRAADPAPTDGPLHIEAWSDSSFADDVDTQRTTLGYVIRVNGATIISNSKLSARVDSCVNHSELHAFDAATAAPGQDQLTDGASVSIMRTNRTVAWVRGVKAGLERRTVVSVKPTTVYVDNSGVIAMLKDATLKSANKHIYRTLQENRERVHLDKSVVAVKVGTKDNLANAMTKQEPGSEESAAQLRCIAGPISSAFSA